ncbi:unnamed protein product [Caenorhabditis auriculariae]|uniref:Uncharacterized protein n=1 Tax=Caenorhabditis auriculariae TaxID=2777116 RepID=A0A8S1HDF1_9PELO|nr:unnamed protein product [Caenorhabditis auriculariae]
MPVVKRVVLMAPLEKALPQGSYVVLLKHSRSTRNEKMNPVQQVENNAENNGRKRLLDNTQTDGVPLDPHEKIELLEKRQKKSPTGDPDDYDESVEFYRNEQKAIQDKINRLAETMDKKRKESLDKYNDDDVTAFREVMCKLKLGSSGEKASPDAEDSSMWETLKNSVERMEKAVQIAERAIAMKEMRKKNYFIDVSSERRLSKRRKKLLDPRETMGRFNAFLRQKLTETWPVAGETVKEKNSGFLDQFEKQICDTRKSAFDFFEESKKTLEEIKKNMERLSTSFNEEQRKWQAAFDSLDPVDRDIGSTFQGEKLKILRGTRFCVETEKSLMKLCFALEEKRPEAARENQNEAVKDEPRLEDQVLGTPDAENEKENLGKIHIQRFLPGFLPPKRQKKFNRTLQQSEPKWATLSIRKIRCLSKNCRLQKQIFLMKKIAFFQDQEIATFQEHMKKIKAHELADDSSSWKEFEESVEDIKKILKTATEIVVIERLQQNKKMSVSQVKYNANLVYQMPTCDDSQNEEKPLTFQELINNFKQYLGGKREILLKIQEQKDFFGKLFEKTRMEYTCRQLPGAHSTVSTWEELKSFRDQDAEIHQNVYDQLTLLKDHFGMINGKLNSRFQKDPLSEAVGQISNIFEKNEAQLNVIANMAQAQRNRFNDYCREYKRNPPVVINSRRFRSAIHQLRITFEETLKTIESDKITANETRDGLVRLVEEKRFHCEAMKRSSQPNLEIQKKTSDEDQTVSKPSRENEETVVTKTCKKKTSATLPAGELEEQSQKLEEEPDKSRSGDSIKDGSNGEALSNSTEVNEAANVKGQPGPVENSSRVKDSEKENQVDETEVGSPSTNTLEEDEKKADFVLGETLQETLGNFEKKRKIYEDEINLHFLSSAFSEGNPEDATAPEMPDILSMSASVEAAKKAVQIARDILSIQESIGRDSQRYPRPLPIIL